MDNLPNNWDDFYIRCACGYNAHMSEGCHDCPLDFEEPKRPWLKQKGYEFDRYDRVWSATVSDTAHICRRAHKDGSITPGIMYRKRTARFIDDKTGKQWHEHYKWVPLIAPH